MPGFESFLLDQVDAAVVATDIDGRVIHWNGHAALLYGWTREEALGRDLTSLVVTESAQGEAGGIMEGLREGRSWSGEFTVRRKDGTVIQAYVSDSPILDPDGRVVGMVGVSVDISERVKADRRLAARTAVTTVLAEANDLEEATERILRAMCESLGWQLGAIWRVDAPASLLRCVDVWQHPSASADAFARATRDRTFERGEGLPGRVWATAVAAWIPDATKDDNFPRGPVAAHDSLHGAFGFPILLRGEVLGVLEFFSREIEEPDEQLLQLLFVVGSQIGQFMERVEVEKAVRQSEARNRAVLEAALDCVLMMDHRGRLVEFNPAAEQTFGHAREDVIGRDMADVIIPPGLREAHRRGLAHFLDTGEGPILGQRVELTGLRSDGTEFPVEVAITRVEVPGPPVFTGYLRDLTARREVERSLGQSTERLRLAIEAGQLGTWHWDIESGAVSWDETVERIYGFEPGTFGGRLEEYSSRIHPEDRQRVAAAVEHARETGEGFQFEHRVIRPDGSVRWVDGRGSCSVDGSGHVVAMTGVTIDITERRQSEDTLRFLAEASALLAAAVPDYVATLEQVARLAVPVLADWCVVDLLEVDGSIRQLAVAHVDPAKVALAQSFRERFPPDPNAPTGVPNVIRTGRSELYAEISDDLLTAAVPDEEVLRTLRDLGLRSSMTVPLTARGRTVGAMTLVAAESGRRFGPTDLAFAEDLASRAAMAMDNARLLEDRRQVAGRLQASLLPPELPDIPGVQVHGQYRWAGEGSEVGGDFYDVFENDDGSWSLVIGDVCGKGVDAAVITGMARNTIRASALHQGKPSTILANLNTAMRRQATDSTFVTVCYVRMRRTEHGARLTVCCAGHPEPLILRAGGEVEVAGTNGTLLGIFPDPELTDVVADLGPGDALVLYTDGVVEEHVMAGEVFGRERLEHLLETLKGSTAEEIGRGIERAVLEFRAEPTRDDIAVLTVRVDAT